MGIADMKPFDLEAAKRGEPIQSRIDGEWNNVKFVGLGFENAVIVDHVSMGTLRYREDLADRLRMAPKKRTIFVNVYQMRHESRDAYQACAFDERPVAIHDSAVNSAKFHAIAIPIEIEE